VAAITSPQMEAATTSAIDSSAIVVVEPRVSAISVSRTGDSMETVFKIAASARTASGANVSQTNSSDRMVSEMAVVLLSRRNWDW